MQPRALRIRASSAFPATLAKRAYVVLNISVTGAVGVLNGARLTRGNVYRLRIGDGAEVLELNACVVRTSAIGEWWETAVQFHGPASAHRIAAVIAVLTRHVRQP